MAGLSRSEPMEAHNFIPNLKHFVLPMTSATSSVHHTTRNQMVKQKVLLRTSSILWKKSNLQNSQQLLPLGKTQDGPTSPVQMNYFSGVSWEYSYPSCVPLFVRLPQHNVLPLLTQPGSGPCLLYLPDEPFGYRTKPAHQAMDNKIYYPLHQQHRSYLHTPDGRSPNHHSQQAVH